MRTLRMSGSGTQQTGSVAGLALTEGTRTGKEAA